MVFPLGKLVLWKIRQSRAGCIFIMHDFHLPLNLCWAQGWVTLHSQQPGLTTQVSVWFPVQAMAPCCHGLWQWLQGRKNREGQRGLLTAIAAHSSCHVARQVPCWGCATHSLGGCCHAHAPRRLTLVGVAWHRTLQVCTLRVCVSAVCCSALRSWWVFWGDKRGRVSPVLTTVCAALWVGLICHSGHMSLSCDLKYLSMTQQACDPSPVSPLAPLARIYPRQQWLMAPSGLLLLSLPRRGHWSSSICQLISAYSNSLPPGFFPFPPGSNCRTGELPLTGVMRSANYHRVSPLPGKCWWPHTDLHYGFLACTRWLVGPS